LRSIAKIFSTLFWMFIPRRFFAWLYEKWTNIHIASKLIFLVISVFVTSGVSMAYKLSKDHSELRDIRCLAMNIYHEARGEPQSGKYAVAAVTMNRVKSGKHPNDVCNVVYKRIWHKKKKIFISAFSWTSDKHSDIPKNSTRWLESVRIAKDVYSEKKKTKAKDALFYHADYVSPYWAAKKEKIAKIGRHIFYK